MQEVKETLRQLQEAQSETQHDLGRKVRNLEKDYD